MTPAVGAGPVRVRSGASSGRLARPPGAVCLGRSIPDAVGRDSGAIGGDRDGLRSTGPATCTWHVPFADSRPPCHHTIASEAGEEALRNSGTGTGSPIRCPTARDRCRPRQHPAGGCRWASPWGGR
ncbi:hypothetical protein GZL_09255 [Streptomyces sp. 769]|nr:hypothetical protein GZL_09255 [Streptomyces sp. 769]